MKSKSFIWLAVLALLAAVFLGGCGSSGSEEPEEKAKPVSVAEVEKGNLVLTVDIPAAIDARMVVDVVPKTQGMARVASVHVKEGQRVKKGQILVQLETRELKAQLQQAQAALVSARNALVQARSGIEQAELSYNNAKTNFERMETLYQQGIISQQDYENAKMQLEIARSTYEAAKQQVQVDPDTGYQYLEAQVKQAEANVELARANLDNARVVSPISGTVVALNVDPGEMAASVPVATVMDMDMVIASAKITEKNVNSLKEGQEVLIKIASLDDFEGTYKITKIVPAADNSKTYKVEVSIPNEKHAIKPGMSAIIEAATKEIKDVMLLPRDAVVKRSGRDVVFVVEDDKVEAVEVTPGESTDELIIIEKGVRVGDKVVTAGQHLLDDGDTVVVRGGGGTQ
ncbi:MAG TPA: efflux RND transporter periplasmic adaptor subunit [Clostridia bacterium]|nr:efflux RND transporter periplasmic adaptor subunit [Clostridia bacterium]